MRRRETRRRVFKTIAAAGTAVLGTLPLAGRAGKALVVRELHLDGHPIDPDEFDQSPPLPE